MSDINALITDHLDVWSSTIKKKKAVGRGSSKKIELYGIKKLRELILELAITGLLVPQVKNESLSSDLLKKFYEEKTKLIKEGKLKKTKNLLPVDHNELHFELPLGWSVARLGNLAKMISKGTTPTSVGYAFEESGISFVKIENINKGRIQTSSITQFISNETHGALKRSQLQVGDLLFSIAGTIGKTAIVIEGDLPANTNQALAFIRGTRTIFNPDFLKIQLDSFVAEKTRQKARGGAMPNVSLSDLSELTAVIPPKAEQNRIVTKVDELMALCDLLEQQQEDSISAHQTLVKTLLDALVDSASHSQITEAKTKFEQAWERIAEHFDTLFTTEGSIDQLKQTILQLAVMGKLVPQDPSDEPASELLRSIAVNKERLVKEKKIRKQKPLPLISDDEKPFELRQGWAWERVGNFTTVGTGATPSRDNPSYWQPPEFNWVSSGETGQDYIFNTKERVSQKAISETNVSIYPKGTLVIAMYGQGKTRGQITELMIEAGTNQACAAIQLLESTEEHRKYIKLYFVKAYEEIRSHSAGGAQPNLNVGKIANTVIALPPIKEQRRIVKRIDELMAFCDQLNAQLSRAQIIQLHLTDVIGQSITGEEKSHNVQKKEIAPMKILTELTLGAVAPDDSALIALLITRDDGSADARAIWSKSKLPLPDFYKQLKKEISAGFINKPPQANFEI